MRPYCSEKVVIPEEIPKHYREIEYRGGKVLHDSMIRAVAFTSVIY